MHGYSSLRLKVLHRTLKLSCRRWEVLPLMASSLAIIPLSLTTSTGYWKHLLQRELSLPVCCCDNTAPADHFKVADWCHQRLTKYSPQKIPECALCTLCFWGGHPGIVTSQPTLFSPWIISGLVREYLSIIIGLLLHLCENFSWLSNGGCQYDADKIQII